MPNLSDQDAKRAFGFIELGIVAILALLAWILVWLNGMDKLYVKMDVRVEYLEQQSARGERFTASDGRVLKNDIQHTNEMLLAHIKRTEPKIDKIYDHILGIDP